MHRDGFPHFPRPKLQEVAVTDRYLCRIAPVELVTAMRAREWSVDG